MWPPATTRPMATATSRAGSDCAAPAAYRLPALTAAYGTNPGSTSLPYYPISLATSCVNSGGVYSAAGGNCIDVCSAGSTTTPTTGLCNKACHRKRRLQRQHQYLQLLSERHLQQHNAAVYECRMSWRRERTSAGTVIWSTLSGDGLRHRHLSMVRPAIRPEMCTAPDTTAQRGHHCVQQRYLCLLYLGPLVQHRILLSRPDKPSAYVSAIRPAHLP